MQPRSEASGRDKHRYAVQRGTDRVIIEAPSRGLAEIVFIKIYGILPDFSAMLPDETTGPTHVREHEVRWDA